MEEIRIYVTSGLATFVCPKCAKARTSDVSKITGTKSEVKINCKCKCGYKFKTILERRKFFRKNIELNGTCKSEKEMNPVVVTFVDISRSGCKIKLNAGNNNFSIDDKLFVEFNLDDSNHSLITKRAVVRSSSGNMIGAEFESIDEYDKLGHYLMFK